MKRTKLMLGTMILGVSMAGAAWAQPAPNHDRDVGVHRAYSADRDDHNQWHGDREVYLGGYNRYANRRGDGDHDRDDRGT